MSQRQTAHEIPAGDDVSASSRDGTGSPSSVQPDSPADVRPTPLDADETHMTRLRFAALQNDLPIRLGRTSLDDGDGDGDGDGNGNVNANGSGGSGGCTATNKSDCTGNMSIDWPRAEPRPPAMRLPAELLMLIFSKLGSTGDMLSCLLVCRAWAMACVPILWHRPACSNWRNLQNVSWSVTKQDPLFDYANLIRRLNLSTLHAQVSSGTLVPFLNCTRIERLTLTTCKLLTDQPIGDLVARNHLLQALDVTDVEGVTDTAVLKIAKNCPRIQGLNLTGCVNVTDDSLVTVAEMCPLLKRIKLNNVSSVTDATVKAIAQSCSGLVEIDLFNCPLVTSEAVTELLSNLRVLRELRLGYCTLIDDTAFTNVSDDLVYDSLRILDLAGCENLRDAGMIRVLLQAPKLRNLVLAKCRFLTDRTLYAIMRLGKNLHYLHLGHVWNISDAGLIMLIRACSRIRYIDLACCSRLTDRSICALAGLPKLRRIGLVKCQNITDASIRAIAGVGARPFAHPLPSHADATMHRYMSSAFTERANAANYLRYGVPWQPNPLERVHLSYCVNLTIDSIHLLLNACPRLTHVSLTGVQAFLRRDLTVFCRPAPNDFTAQQRDVFCVFSGDGVLSLRNYLNANHRPTTFDQRHHHLAQRREGGHGWDQADEDGSDAGSATTGQQQRPRRGSEPPARHPPPFDGTAGADVGAHMAGPTQVPLEA
ncbi:SCF ubiquitin ligase complex subunit, partial [Ascosphaera acerosa]